MVSGVPVIVFSTIRAAVTLDRFIPLGTMRITYLTSCLGGTFPAAKRDPEINKQVTIRNRLIHKTLLFMALTSYITG